MKKGHDAALGIAARSGDKWAIQSYYPPQPSQDPEYWKAIHETNPLLLHRWMATVQRGTILNDEERMWHAVKAYSIERETLSYLDLTEYVEQFRYDATLSQLLSDSDDGDSENDTQRSVDEKAVDLIADDTLLKYPW